MKKKLLYLLLLFMIPTFVYAEDCDQRIVTIEYDLNGGNNCTGCVSQLQDISFTNMPTVTRDGYEFTGWTLNGRTINSGDSLVGDSTECTVHVTLKANYRVKCADIDENKVTVSFNGVNISSMTVDINNGFDPSTLKTDKKGMVFEGFYYESSFTTKYTGGKINVEPKTDSNGCRLSNTITMYAKYSCGEPVNTITVNFDSDGGSAVNSVSVKDKLTSLTKPTKKGYTFKGWFLSDGTEYKEGDDLPKEADIVDNNGADCNIGYKSVTLKAKWEEVVCPKITNKEVTVSFVTNGGSSVASKTICISCGSNATNVEIPETKKSKYIFNGWFYDKNFKNRFSGADLTDVKLTTKYDDDGCEKGYADVTLYAKWEEVTCPEYSGEGIIIRFNTYGGSNIENIKLCPNCTYAEGEIPTAPVPTKDGYVFQGWFYDKDFIVQFMGEDLTVINKEPILDENECITAYENITLYAKFTMAEDTAPAVVNNIYNYNPKGSLVSMGLGVGGIALLGVYFGSSKVGKKKKTVAKKIDE